MKFESDENAERVVKVMRRKVGTTPDAAGFHTLGCAELHLGLVPEAVKHLRRAVELRPDFGEALFALVRACLENNDIEGARSAAAKATDLGLALPPDLAARLG
jgi:Flp pilus assembly protein TadD